MWELRISDECGLKLKRYTKDRRREIEFVLGNLQSFLSALNKGACSQDVRVGFIHPEPGGFLAITERGAGKNAIPLRLYVYPDDTARVLYLITIGDKKSQPQDILFCKNSLKFLQSEGHATNVQDEGLP